jgi:hypothetical protein
VTVPYQPVTSLYYKSIIDNCDFQGMGVANYNAYISAARWVIQNRSAENAAIENIFIGDSAGDSAANDEVNFVRVHNDTNAVPAWAAYNYENQVSADNVVNGLNGDSAIWGGMLLAGSDDQVRNSHMFAYAAGPGIDIESNKAGIDSIVDNPGPGQACYYLNSSIANIHNGWQCTISTFEGNYGIYVNNDGHSTIGCGTGANNTQWTTAYGNLVYFGVTQVTNRVAPCVGNGEADPQVFTGNLTVNGNLSVTGTYPASSPVFMQSGVPFVLVGSCSLSGTGGLSGCGGTQTMPNANTHYAYMWFPASQLASSGTGSAAGWYAVQWTSGTAGQVCSPIVTYTSGTPEIPGACGTFTPNTTGTVTPTTGSDIVAITNTLPAHTLGVNGQITYDFAFTADASGGSTHAPKLKFGSSASANQISLTSGTVGIINWRITNGGAENINTSYVTANTSSGANANQISTNPTYPNIGTNSDQTVSVTLQISAAANTFLIMEAGSIKTYPSN